MEDEVHLMNAVATYQKLKKLRPQKCDARCTDPPPWRSLCKELTPHSKYLIRNIDLCAGQEFSLESPATFCHYEPDTEEVHRHQEEKLPKTLVCHDMANGYHDDSMIDGTGNYDAYNFYNWAGIDIFCYFSHHLITIPPLAWINVGHAHGVKVIGTIITEWSDGVAFWEQMLQSEQSYQELASSLVAIAKTLKFDGWLLNIENKISKPLVLLDFVKHFHKILHEELSDPVLVWYDSVTIQGNLNWQNGLNEKNKDFFDACDGFFTNYSWSESDVTKSAQAAGDRINDLFIGIDVFGRNFYGGGQFNTQKAVKLAHAAGCSLAIFAPAWTHEAMPDGDEPHASDRTERFLLRDRAFWDSLWPYLNTRAPALLPFRTSFCRGQGRRRWHRGDVVSPQPWFNLRHQQYQTNAAHGPHGYLLSTVANMARTARAARALAEGGDEVVRYRRSFACATDKAGVVLDDSPAPSSDEEREPAPADAPQPSVKRKMRDALRQLFKRKAREEGSAPAWASGRSLLRLSLTLRLGAEARARWDVAAVPGEAECVALHADDAFSGGACLRVAPSDAAGGAHRHSRLLLCDFRLQGAAVACVVTKRLRSAPEQTLTVALCGRAGDGRPLRLSLVGREAPPGRDGAPPAPAGIVVAYPLDPSGARFRDLRSYLLLHRPDFYVPVENLFDWTVRYYEVAVGSCRVTAVNVRTGMAKGDILLGYFALCDRPEVHSQPTGSHV